MIQWSKDFLLANMKFILRRLQQNFLSPSLWIIIAVMVLIVIAASSILIFSAIRNMEQSTAKLHEEIALRARALILRSLDDLFKEEDKTSRDTAEILSRSTDT